MRRRTKEKRATRDKLTARRAFRPYDLSGRTSAVRVKTEPIPDLLTGQGRKRKAPTRQTAGQLARVMREKGWPRPNRAPARGPDGYVEAVIGSTPDGTVVGSFPLPTEPHDFRLVNEGNRSRHEHWAVTRRRAQFQRDRVGGTLAWLVPLSSPAWQVTIVRLMGPRAHAMDNDGLVSCAKHVRDGVQDALGLDDRDPRIGWEYRQERAPLHGVRVVISPRAEPPLHQLVVSASTSVDGPSNCGRDVFTLPGDDRPAAAAYDAISEPGAGGHALQTAATTDESRRRGQDGCRDQDH
jgi:hypothetical protein